ncbi:MAG: Uma2 family endonuclease [Hyphomicrobiaceae bacterium]|nr:Uma2 family endonuclease [Hyphomicrobiaceae bacterium]
MTGIATDRPKLMTVEEFLDWDGGGHQGKMELVNGVVVAMSPASSTHGLIQANIAIAIGNHLRKTGRPCRVGSEQPISPTMGKRLNLRVPDVAVTCTPASDSKTMEEPLLIAEVMSPSNEMDTWASIQAVAGLISLKEILVVQSTRVEAEVYRRRADGGWPDEPNVVVRELGGSLRLESIDLDLALTEIYWQTHLALT